MQDSELFDPSPSRILAAETLRHAVEAWKVQRDRAPGRKPPVNKLMGCESNIETNACTGHAWTCWCRMCLRDWFIGHPAGQEGYLSFALCCDTLGLKQNVVLERLGVK